MNKFFKIKVADVLIFLALLIASIILVANFYKEALFKPSSIILTVERKEYVYPLDVNKEYRVEGLIGETHFVVKDSKVEIISSPCREKTCTNRKIENNGESLVCLPNALAIRLVSLKGNEKGEVDEISF